MKEKETSKMTRYFLGGMDIIELRYYQSREFFITVEVAEGKNAITIQENLLNFLQSRGNAQIISVNLFASSDEWIRAFRSLNPDIPMPCIVTEICREGITGGIYIHAISGFEVRPILLNGQPIGRVYENDQMRCLFMTNVRSENENSSRVEQAVRTFHKIEEALQLLGMSFANVVRTWLYIDDILAWYPDFNRVRTEFFHSHNVFDGLVPASTGVSAKNHTGTGLIANVFAISAKDQLLYVRSVPSPLQCPALNYASSFSRAVEISSTGYRLLLISGTASIDSEGQSMHPGDVRSQINQTLKVVKAILHSRQMSWNNITRAIAYFKYPEDTWHFDAYCSETQIPDFPLLIVKGDICREELLFEIEVDAISIST